jgi:hypothetical protein
MLRLRRAPLLAAALLWTGVLLTPTSGWAASDEEKAGARAAAVEGLRAYSEERWTDVVDLFTRAEALVHSPVHLLYLGRANIKLGKLVLAREQLMKASREHVEPDSPPAFERARASAEAELPGLEPRLSYLTLMLQGADAKAVTVTMDGVKVPAPLIGVPRPVDPGDHKFEASGPGVSATPLVVTTAEGERKSATFTVKLGPVPVASEGTPAAGAGTAAGATAGGATPGGGDQGTAPQSRTAKTFRIASYASFGVGAVGLGMGIAFGLKAKGNRNDANALCDSRGCPDSKQSQINSLDSSANSANTLAIVGFALGGEGIATGATLFYLSMGKKAPPPTTAFVQPWVGVGSAGVSGQF